MMVEEKKKNVNYDKLKVIEQFKRFKVNYKF